MVLSNDKFNLTENIFCHISLWWKASYRYKVGSIWEDSEIANLSVRHTSRESVGSIVFFFYPRRVTF